LNNPNKPQITKKIPIQKRKASKRFKIKGMLFYFIEKSIPYTCIFVLSLNQFKTIIYEFKKYCFENGAKR
jgi:hypothetical protein